MVLVLGQLERDDETDEDEGVQHALGRQLRIDCITHLFDDANNL